MLKRSLFGANAEKTWKQGANPRERGGRPSILKNGIRATHPPKNQNPPPPPPTTTKKKPNPPPTPTKQKTHHTPPKNKHHQTPDPRPIHKVKRPCQLGPAVKKMGTGPTHTRIHTTYRGGKHFPKPEESNYKVKNCCDIYPAWGKADRHSAPA